MIVHTSEPLPRLGEKDWKVLMERIDSKKCTPIIGSETRSEDFAVRSEIAREWAQEYDFPLSSSVNLARVSRFVSANYDAEYAKKMLVKRLANAPKPDLDDPADPYRILARLQLPIYITTNYDDFMFQALVKADRAPKAEMCRWWRDAVQSSIFDDGFEPKAATPVVFHFHGVTEELDSLVLTEDDYFEFLINVSKDNLVPPRIEKAFSGSSLLLLGYRLDDWDFRVLFHLVAGYLERSISRTHVAVQIAPLDDKAPQEQRKKAQDYLNLYFAKYRKLDLKVYWGTCREFMIELETRWKSYAN